MARIGKNKVEDEISSKPDLEDPEEIPGKDKKKGKDKEKGKMTLLRLLLNRLYRLI